MLIILEGCDGTGKSTIAKRLASVLNAEVIHCSTKTPNNYDFFSEIIYHSRERNIIADRFMYGQFVYQEENERKLTKAQLYQLETQLLSAGAKVVLVSATEKDIEARLGARNEKLINGLSISEVKDRFNHLMEDSMLPVKLWDTSTGITTEVE